MAEPLTLLGAAFTGALTGRLRSLSSWLVANTVSVALLALLGTIIALCIVATLLHQFDLFTEL